MTSIRAEDLVRRCDRLKERGNEASRGLSGEASTVGRMCSAWSVSDGSLVTALEQFADIRRRLDDLLEVKQEIESVSASISGLTFASAQGDVEMVVSSLSLLERKMDGLGY